jgi:hypothetical protein
MVGKAGDCGPGWRCSRRCSALVSCQLTLIRELSMGVAVAPPRGCDSIRWGVGRGMPGRGALRRVLKSPSSRRVVNVGRLRVARLLSRAKVDQSGLADYGDPLFQIQSEVSQVVKMTGVPLLKRRRVSTISRGLTSLFATPLSPSRKRRLCSRSFSGAAVSGAFCPSGLATYIYESI